MRIGFIGSHGTGKTSLAKHMTEMPEWRDHVFVPSGVRRISNLVKINRDAGPYDQLLSTCARIADEELLSDGGKTGTISDRTPLDSLAYTAYQHHNIWTGNPGEYMQICEGLVRQSMRTYDALVYFPVYWTPEDDGVRLVDPDYQRQVAAYCVRYLTKFKLNYYVISDASVEERAKRLTKLLNRKD